MPESVLAEIQATPGVDVATGDVQVLGVTLIDAEGEPVGSIGPPQFGFSFPEYPDDARLSGLTVVEGRAPTAPEEIAIDLQSAESGGFEVGDTVTVVTQGPRIEARLVGLVRFGVTGTLAGATLTMFDREYAQNTFIGGDAWNQVSVLAEDGVTSEQLRDDITAAIGPRYAVEIGLELQDESAEQFSTALGFINTFLLVFAFIALFVGTFIILNTFSMLVARRTRELALLRAIGASKSQITWSVVGEALLLGLLGGFLGILLGIGVALGLRKLLGVIGAELPAGDLVLAPRTIIVGMAVGVIVTVLAAWFPARRASQVPPVAAMRDELALPARSLRLRANSGFVLAGVGAVALLVAVVNEDLAGRLTVAGLGALALLLGVITLAPVFSRGLVGAVGAPVTTLGSVGTLAVRNAQRDRRRTAATATAILVGLALVTALGVLGASTTKSTDALVDDVIAADFIVQPSGFVPFSTQVGDSIEEVPGVTLVSRIRQTPALVNGAESLVTGVEPETITQMQTTGIGSAAPSPGGIVVDSETAAEEGLSVGDTVEVTWSGGVTDSLVLQETYERQAALATSSGWGVPLATMEEAELPAVDSFLFALLDPEADVDAARVEFDQIQAAYPTVQILDQTEFKESITGEINQLLSVVYALLGLSVIIAIFGVVNTLALSIIERTHEIGMLRAVGMLRKQVRTMIRWESIVISFFGAFTGLILGLLLGIALQQLLKDEGITELVIPWTLVVVVLVCTSFVGVLAAVWPARRAANLDILAAIRTE